MMQVTVIGGGLAGSEAAWQCAQRGINVLLYEMRPAVKTGAHASSDLGELVCSNSLGSSLADRASGMMMAELGMMGSLLLRIAREVAVPAGSALAVDRTAFAHLITQSIESHPKITIIREEAKTIPRGVVIVASGPLTSPALSTTLLKLTGEDHLYFFDALSPIVETNTINTDVAFKASRYGRGVEEEGDYINCPFTQADYDRFVDALLRADRIPLRSFEAAIRDGVRAGMSHFFEGCLPVEVIAERGQKALAFGPMRPVGLEEPRSGVRPYAVVQLRRDDLSGDLYNLVGFQTNLTYAEQRRVFRMIPGLERARFARFGQMHRNTFLNSPKLLNKTLQTRDREDLFFAGQITGVEGYLGNMATGLLAGVNASRFCEGKDMIKLPQETMLGALCHYITEANPDRFQPMKANLGILPPLSDGQRRNRRQRAKAHAERAARIFEDYWELSGEVLYSTLQMDPVKVKGER